MHLSIYNLGPRAAGGVLLLVPTAFFAFLHIVFMRRCETQFEGFPTVPHLLNCLCVLRNIRSTQERVRSACFINVEAARDTVRA